MIVSPRLQLVKRPVRLRGRPALATGVSAPLGAAELCVGQRLVSIQIRPYPDDLAVAESDEESRSDTHVRAAGLATSTFVEQGEHRIADLSNLLDLERVVRHRFPELREVGPDLLGSAVDAGLWKRRIFVELALGIDGLEEGVNVAAVVRLPLPPHELYAVV